MSRLHISGTRRRVAIATTASAVLVGVGLGSTPAAQGADSSECPEALPLSALTAGDPVVGKTVTTGTTPEGFGGTVVGVLEDGIAPGTDMILADLDSPTIDRVGIWSGMSGSPVYAPDGRLVGAVSYSLGLGPSTIAGITPAESMYALRTSAATQRSARTKVALPASLKRAVAATGATGTTMKRLRVPVGLSGLSSTRLEQLAPALNGRGVHVADVAGGPTSQEPIDVTAGGNLAASLAYGTITAAGVGTATAVCGDEVLGFGHPMTFSGPATMSLHGARATHIQDDQTLSGFKVTNLGAPIGTIDGDRMAGLHGVKGALPTAYPLSATATSDGVTKQASTNVTVQGLLAELGFSNLIAAQDQAIDRIGQGTAKAGWTIEGTRKNGTPFSFTREDLYADQGDISVATAIGLAEDLFTIQENPGEVVKITSVESSAELSDVYESYVVSKVQAYQSGAWRTLSSSKTNKLKAGKVAMKILLTSREGDPRTLTTSVTVPSKAVSRPGWLTVTGGNAGSYDSEEFFYFEDEAFDEFPAPSEDTFPGVLKDMAAGPKNNEVEATLKFRASGTAGKKQVVTAATPDRVVSGFRQYRVVGTR